MPAPTGATRAGEHDWCILRAEGKSYGEIARAYGLDESTVRVALQKSANVARTNRITAELEDAAVSAARHNVAAAVGEKCRLRLAYAKSLGIESEESTPKVGIDSSVLTRDYLAVDKALLEHLESYGKRRRETNQDERIGDIHELDLRRARILLDIAEAAKNGDGIGDSLQNGRTLAHGDEALPNNKRAY